MHARWWRGRFAMLIVPVRSPLNLYMMRAGCFAVLPNPALYTFPARGLALFLLIMHATAVRRISVRLRPSRRTEPYGSESLLCTIVMLNRTRTHTPRPTHPLSLTHTSSTVRFLLSPTISFFGRPLPSVSLTHTPSPSSSPCKKSGFGHPVCAVRGCLPALCRHGPRGRLRGLQGRQPLH